MLTLYHLRVSRSERILWLLEELGIDYEVVAFDRDPTFRAPAAMREIHPLGKSPILRDGGQLLIESGAIVEHLVSRHGNGRLVPEPGTPAHGKYLHWLHYSEGTLMAWLVSDLLACSGLVPGVDPGPLRALLADELAKNLRWIDGELAGSEFATGDAFSAADVMLAYSLRFARDRGHTHGMHHIEGYVARMEAREAYRRAVRKAA